jgi:hypothetical protein
MTVAISAAATAMVVQYGYNHPESLLARHLCRLAGICTTGPAPRANTQPALIHFDDAELPAPLIPMSPELEAACRWDLTELRAISALAAEQNAPGESAAGVRTVAWTGATSEDEFTYPRQEPAEESVLAGGERIKSYPVPLPDEVFEELPPPSPAEPQPPQKPAPQANRANPFNIEVELCLAGLPAVAAPQIGVQHLARQILDGCTQVQAVSCQDRKPGSASPKCPVSCEIIESCDQQGTSQCTGIARAAVRESLHPEVKAVIILLTDPLSLPAAPVPPLPPMPIRIEHPFPIPAFAPVPLLREVFGGDARPEAGCQICPCQPSLGKDGCKGCMEKCDYTRRVYPVADLLDPSEEHTPEHLIRIICRTVAPKSWEEAGGCGVVDFYPFGKALVVYHAEEVHEQIGELLAELRATVNGSGSGDSELRRAGFKPTCPEKPSSSRRTGTEDCERCKQCPETDR